MSSAGSGSELDINRPMSARAQVALEKISNSPETIRAMSEISKKMFLSTHDIRYVDPKLLEESKPTHGQASPTKGQTSEIDKAGPSTGKPPTQQPTGTKPKPTPVRPANRQTTELDPLEKRARTLFIIGGSRARRMASHARKLCPSPIFSTSKMAYTIAEIGEIGMKPNLTTANTWLEILRAAELREGDIVMVDPFSTVAWMDGNSCTPPLEEPHLRRAITPPISQNGPLEEAISAVLHFLENVGANVIVVILAPNPRYLVEPCCRDHMPEWTELTKPQIFMDSLLKLDEEIRTTLSKEINCSYINLKLAAARMMGAKTPPVTAWAAMTTKTNLFLTNPASKILLNMVVEAGANKPRLEAIKNANRQKTN